VSLNSLIFFYISKCSSESEPCGNDVWYVCIRGQGSHLLWFPW